jgi:hypothetical protein
LVQNFNHFLPSWKTQPLARFYHCYQLAAIACMAGKAGNTGNPKLVNFREKFSGSVDRGCFLGHSTV